MNSDNKKNNNSKNKEKDDDVKKFETSKIDLVGMIEQIKFMESQLTFLKRNIKDMLEKIKKYNID